MHQFIFNLRQNHIRTCSEVPWFYIATGEEYDASNHTPRVENSKWDFCQGLPGVFSGTVFVSSKCIDSCPAYEQNPRNVPLSTAS